MSENKKTTVLIVDDTAANISLLMGLLKDTYRLKAANNGEKALQLATSSPPDLILLDIMMPGIDGYEVCSRLKENERTKNIPIIFLTAKVATEDEEYGFQVGAVDFIHKPISPAIVKARVSTHLKVKAWQDSLIDNNAWLEQEVTKRLSQIDQLQNATIHVMVSLAEFRDECTGNHIRRTQALVRALAENLSKTPQYASELNQQKIDLYTKSAPLHDIGKITIPDEILLKPDRLTADEFEIMKTHAQRGYEILNQANSFMGDDGEFLKCAMDIALNHHEKWNGEGYPNKLKGTQIPFPARLMAVADVYDALRSERPYKRAFTHQEALNLMVKDSGDHFEPAMIDALVAIEDESQFIIANWPD